MKLSKPEFAMGGQLFIDIQRCFPYILFHAPINFDRQ
jgi:hypothetical protein